MPLSDLQTALGKLIAARASAKCLSPESLGWLDSLKLTPEERTWLEQLIDSPGFDVTCQIQRWWREMRLKSMARMTLALLKPDHRIELVSTYLESTPCPSLFLVPEALGFLEFVICASLKIPHLEAVAKFERALLMAAQAAPLSSKQMSDIAGKPLCEVIQSQLPISIVEFSAPPEKILGALMNGQPLPESQEDVFPVLVAPWLPQLWQPIAKGTGNRESGIGNRESGIGSRE
ncbi:hypothetical protein [Moorena producens]|uniref:hypothetical protein n=1 Tax=Moorena producens TaxID=1155739 RepID=UPI003C77C585